VRWKSSEKLDSDSPESKAREVARELFSEKMKLFESDWELGFGCLAEEMFAALQDAWVQ
jgi:hypothetical protein